MCSVKWFCAAMLLVVLSLPAWAVQLTNVPSEIPVVITFRHPVTQAVTTERFVWQEERFTEKQRWPIYDIRRERATSWGMYRLLPTELNSDDPEGTVLVRDPTSTADNVVWQRGADRVRFRVGYFTIESPHDRQPDILDRSAGEAEDLGLDELLAEIDEAPTVEDADGREIILRSPIALPNGRLPMEFIDRIVIPYPRGWSGKITGRYLRYHQRWTGTGKVQPVRATFLGSDGNDDLVNGGFLPDGRIVAFGTIANPTALAPYRPVVLGRDPAVDAETTITVTRRRREREIELEQGAPVLWRFSSGLERVEKVVRLPVRTGTARMMSVADNGAITIVVRTRPNVEAFVASLSQKQIVAGAEDSDPQFGSLVMRFNQDLELQWAVMFEGRGVSVGERPDDSIVAWSGNQFWAISARGQVSDGPVLQHARRGNTATSWATDAIVQTGHNNSATGREPWKRPHWRHWNGAGELQMILYDWPGPLVGLDIYRQVSDALSYRGTFDPAGNYLLYATHDGGNVVAANVPYDLSRRHNKFGALSDLSAASVNKFTVLLRLNMETYDVMGATWIAGYHPILDYPTGGSIHDTAVLGDNRVAVAGVFSYGMIETQDTWYPSVFNRRNDPSIGHADVRGGSNLMILSEDLGKAIFASVIPNNGHMRLAAQGTRVLITARCGPTVNVYGDILEPITKDPIQQGHAGGATDGWIMLVETEGAH
ncbi:MAG: hypothetical protein EA401_09605 [Planctomycetota bacterium]|nr:MAG: hypothetical protein EA401_09605 [Planctomycetota bacterium]